MHPTIADFSLVSLLVVIKPRKHNSPGRSKLRKGRRTGPLPGRSQPTTQALRSLLTRLCGPPECPPGQGLPPPSYRWQVSYSHYLKPQVQLLTMSFQLTIPTLPGLNSRREALRGPKQTTSKTAGKEERENCDGSTKHSEMATLKLVTATTAQNKPLQSPVGEQ